MIAITLLLSKAILKIYHSRVLSTKALVLQSEILMCSLKWMRDSCSQWFLLVSFSMQHSCFGGYLHLSVQCTIS